MKALDMQQMIRKAIERFDGNVEIMVINGKFVAVIPIEEPPKPVQAPIVTV